MKAVIHDLEKILVLAARCQRAFPEDDEQMRQLLGGIVVNADDALGALRDARRLHVR